MDQYIKFTVISLYSSSSSDDIPMSLQLGMEIIVKILYPDMIRRIEEITKLLNYMVIYYPATFYSPSNSVGVTRSPVKLVGILQYKFWNTVTYGCSN